MAQKKKNKRRRRQFQQKVILSVLLVIIIGLIGVLGGIRTPDPRLRRPLLYPTELQAHSFYEIVAASG